MRLFFLVKVPLSHHLAVPAQQAKSVKRIDMLPEAPRYVPIRHDWHVVVAPERRKTGGHCEQSLEYNIENYQTNQGKIDC